MDGETSVLKHLQLHSLPPKGVQGDLKGPKHVCMHGWKLGLFPPLWGGGGGLMTINHLCQQKAFFSFRIRGRQG